MCGICGFTRAERHLPESIIDEMKTSLRHRGPDDSGSFATDRVVLGHTRLSIIDLEGGHQPMTDASGRLTIVFNGEIYGFEDLRDDLVARGVEFSTRSDTEVLLHLYRLYGAEMLGRLEGMFAFALYDSERDSLLLARDRFGKKPLYYAVRGGQLIFASELKALVRHPHVAQQLDPAALRQYLAFEYVPAPRTIYRGVKKLEAGHFLRFEQGQVKVERYWDFPVDAPPFEGSAREAEAELIGRLDAAVVKRLRSDVPLGVFLSGGIDSSAVLALTARHVEPGAIKTFSIGFTEPSYDESGHARTVARAFETDHREERMDAARAIDVLPEVVAQFDEPFADASALPTYLLSRFARKEVTVVLSGDGGDELFAGYDPFVAHRLAHLARGLPASVLAGIGRGVRAVLPPSDTNMNLGFRLERFLPHVHRDPVTRNQLWLSAFPPAAQGELLHRDLRGGEPVFQPLDEIVGRARGLHWLTAVQWAYVRTYLQDDILVKVDRASMANSLEVRSPFLDSGVADLAARLPARSKLRGLTTKYVLKRALRGTLPAAIVRRPKKGFGIPKSQWLREPLRRELEERFSSDSLEREGLFEPTTVRRLLTEHFERRADRQKELWTLLMFELWRERHGIAGV